MSFAPAELLSDSFATDPHPVYHRMRGAAPVLWHEPTAGWYVTGHREVGALLREPTLSARPGDGFTDRLTGGDRAAGDRVEDFFDRWMVFSDAPAHTRLRTAASAMCAPRAAEAWRDAASRDANTLLADLDLNTADFAHDFALPLATAVTCDFLGVPADDREQLGVWSDALMAYLAAQWAEPATTRQADRALAELRAYLTARTAARPRDAPSPCLDMLAAVGPDNAPALFAQLLTGGIEPVAACLATAIAETAAGPGPVLEADTADLVEEALRFDAPFHIVPRIATAELVVAGSRLRPGDRVVLVIAAANRDPLVHRDPDRFTPGRPAAGRHLAFGAGQHYCLGAPLARTVLTAGLEAVRQRLRSAAVRGVTAEREPRVGATVWRRVALMA
ncbi:cytochrome P450 [Streptomyces sp. NPDC057509]|uniref:cytochrome P450 n=1 Tax=Streptomyces sp. NPDC057509 TaxID=3346152 RepID=UPI0036BC872E